MRAVVQRVKEASVSINDGVIRRISKGLLVFLGIVADDREEDMEWLAAKISNLRIFDDAAGVMNQSVRDVGGEVMLISQFTLHASTKKGNRPSYIKAAKPDIAVPLYEEFSRKLEKEIEKTPVRGEFGANMQVRLQNDGPVTIIIDTKNRE